MADALPGALESPPRPTMLYKLSSARSLEPLPTNGHFPGPPADHQETRRDHSISDGDMTASAKRPEDVSAHDLVNEDLGKAVHEGSQETALRAIEHGANPNHRHQFRDLRDLAGMPPILKAARPCIGPVIVVAIMKNDIEMVRLLVQTGQVPLAGKESYWKRHTRRFEIEGPPTFATFELSMLKELAVLKADLLEKRTFDSDETTLLWTASHRGSDEMVRFLLMRCSEHLEVACSYKTDDVNDWAMTPLHVASKMGHLQVVKTLLQGRAQVQADPEAKCMPLLDAIDQHHSAVVGLLVQFEADICGHHAMDKLFAQQNVTTIEAVAAGLRKAMEKRPENLERSCLQTMVLKRHILNFFAASGDAMLDMINVIFQRKELRFRCKCEADGSDGLYICNHAYIPRNAKFNIALGPDTGSLDNLILRQEKDQDAMSMSMETAQNVTTSTFSQEHGNYEQFLKTLLPQQSWIYRIFGKYRSTIARSQCPVNVEIYQCVLSGIHDNPEVLLAIANSRNDAIFRDKAVQAILELAFRRVAWLYNFTLCSNLLLVMCFARLSYKVNGPKHIDGRSLFNEDSISEGPDIIWICFMAVIIFVCCCREICQIIGFWMFGENMRYWQDIWNFLDWLSLFIMIVLFVGIMTDFESFVDPAKQSYVGWRILLSLVSFIGWFRLLSTARVRQWAGPTILPILCGFVNVVPFFAVTACPLMGFVHAYYCLGVYGCDMWRTLSVIYRLGVVGDFDLGEMEDVDGHYVSEMVGGAQRFEFVEAEKSDWWITMRVFLIACSLILTVSMMNIFIGVLSESYYKAVENSEAIFWKTRGEMVLCEAAARKAVKTIWGRLLRMCHGRGELRRCTACNYQFDSRTHGSCPKCGQQRTFGAFAESPEEYLMGQQDHDNTGKHIWYCCRAEPKEHAESDGSSLLDKPLTQKDLERLEERLCSDFLEQVEQIRDANDSSSLECPLVKGLKATILDTWDLLDQASDTGQFKSALDANMKDTLEQACAHVGNMLDAVKAIKAEMTDAVEKKVNESLEQTVPEGHHLVSLAQTHQHMQELQSRIRFMEEDNASLHQDVVRLGTDVKDLRAENAELVETLRKRSAFQPQARAEKHATPAHDDA